MLKTFQLTLLLLLALSSCTNVNRHTVKDFADEVEDNGFTLPGDVNAKVGLSKVVQSTNTPSINIDLHGAGDLGQYCFKDQSSQQEGGSTCQCKYEYNGFEKLVPTIYTEGNMVRCPYRGGQFGIPDDVSTVKISIVISGSNLNTNSITIKLPSGPSGIACDSTDASCFAHIKRFQCRDHIFIPNMFDPLIYDPFQSEDTRLSFPLDFYTDNFAKAMGVLVDKSISDRQNFSKWDCTLNPFEPPFWENLLLFSAQGTSTLEEDLIFDPSKRDKVQPKSTFFLSKNQTGTFGVPIQAMIAPFTVTESPDEDGVQKDGTRPPIGFGAAPSSVTEACPSTEIPFGYKWVKVWAFRANIDPRTYVKDSIDRRFTGIIACNPGPRLDEPTLPTFVDCHNGATFAPFLDDTYNEAGNTLVARVMGTKVEQHQACFTFQPGTAGGSPVNEAFDLWERYGFDDQIEELGLIQWGLSRTQRTAETLETEPGTLEDSSRFDYVFVVTPPEITIEQMKADAPDNSIQKPYYPHRYRNQEDCDGIGCDRISDSRLISYEIFRPQIESAQDNARNIYPICAIQPDREDL